jgi:hypothetical protein
MASRSKKAVPFNATDLAAIKANPYVQRLIDDATLRDNVRATFESGRSAFNRLQASKNVQRALLEDKRLQADVREAAEAFRDAAVALSDAPKHPKKRKRRVGRTLMILVIGSVTALALSESLRSKVLDMLFGAEEEFQYTPPPGTPTPPPASPVTAA